MDGDYNPLNFVVAIRQPAIVGSRYGVPCHGSQADSGARGVGGVRWASGAVIFTDAGMSPLSWLGAAGQAFQIDRTFTGCGLIGPNAV